MVIKAGLFKISELERLSGTPRYTIHQYIRQGLLPEPIRTGKTMAYYGPSHLERLRAIREIKGESRLPLAYLKQALEGRGTGHVKGPKVGSSRAEEPPGKGTGERRKQQIKEAAFKVFLEKGFPRARIQDITAAAGVSTGTFYIYYRDKREVFMEVIDELISNAVRPAEEALRKGGDILGRAEEIARFYLENYGYFSGIINQLRGMMAEEEPQARDKFVALHNQLADPIVRGIRAAAASGIIREVDPELLARAIMGMVEFLAIFLSFDRERDASQAVSFLADLLMNGLRVPGPGGPGRPPRLQRG